MAALIADGSIFELSRSGEWQQIEAPPGAKVVHVIARHDGLLVATLADGTLHIQTSTHASNGTYDKAWRQLPVK